LAELNLNNRQLKAIEIIRQRHLFTNSDYQIVTGAARQTAKRDLEDLVKKGVIEPRGSGRGSYYEFLKKWYINGTNGSLETRHKPDINPT
ncbi:MAG: ATP-dependent helicase RecG, partial [Acidobacteriota bacterium]|nr:ATP-dependent helicase RecG [Acidobacteriota bacterium]